MRHEQPLNAKFSNFLNMLCYKKRFFIIGNMHWNRICYGTRLICHTTICWFIRTRNLRKDNICKGSQLESCLSRMNGLHIGSVSKSISVQMALKAPAY